MKRYSNISDLAKAMDKVYLNLDEDGNHEYTLTVKRIDEDTNEYSLYYSNSEIWTESTKGTLVLKLTNDGDNFHFNKAHKKKIEHYEGLHLRLLLTFEVLVEMNEPKKNFIDYETVTKEHMTI